MGDTVREPSGIDDGARARLASLLPAYELGGMLGRGGYGRVIAARHRRLDKPVAIKELAQQFSSDPDVRARFASEARLMASFDHPHIVQVIDFVEDEEGCLLVMDRLDGGTLTQRASAAGMEMAASCAVAIAVAEGLHYAHGRGILHRDIKPDNLLFNLASVPKVSDFGIAKVLGANASAATRAGTIIGTPAYMAPEQAEASEIGPTADIYAIGCVLYQLLSGRLPFTSDASPLVALYQKVHADPTPLTDANPEVPAPIAAVVMQALAKRPEDRIQDAESFADDLARATVATWGVNWISATGMKVLPGARTSAALVTPTPAPAEPAPRKPVVATTQSPVVQPLPPLVSHPGTTSGPGYQLSSGAGAAAQVQLEQAHALAAQDRFADAELAYRAALDHNPNLAPAQVGLGRVLRQLHRPAEAEAAYRVAAHLDPLDATTHVNLGLVRRDLGRPQDAEYAFREAIRLRPYDPTALFHLGLVLVDLGRTGEAEGAFREVVRLNPADPAAWFQHANAAAELRQWPAAERSYREVLRFQPSSSSAHLGLGTALRELKRVPEAEVEAREALRYQPDSVPALLLFAQTLVDQGRPHEAEPVLRQVLQAAPDTVAAHHVLGLALRRLGRPAEAEWAIVDAIHRKPDDPGLRMDLAAVLKELNRLPDVVTAVQAAVQLQPGNAKLHNALGIAYRDLGQLREAEAAFQEAVRIQPTYASAHNNLRLARRDQKRAAAQHAQQAQQQWRPPPPPPGPPQAPPPPYT